MLTLLTALIRISKPQIVVFDGDVPTLLSRVLLSDIGFRFRLPSRDPVNEEYEQPQREPCSTPSSPTKPEKQPNEYGCVNDRHDQQENIEVPTSLI